MWLGGDRLDADCLLLESGRAATRVGLRPPQVVEDHPLVGNKEAPGAVLGHDLAPVNAGPALRGGYGAHLLGGIPPKDDSLVRPEVRGLVLGLDNRVRQVGELRTRKQLGEEADQLWPALLELRAVELLVLVQPDGDRIGLLGGDPERPVLGDQRNLPEFDDAGAHAPQQPDMVVRILGVGDARLRRLLDVDCRPAKDDILHLGVVPSVDDVLLAVHADRPDLIPGGEGDLEQGGLSRLEVADVSTPTDLELLSAEADGEAYFKVADHIHFPIPLSGHRILRLLQYSIKYQKCQGYHA